jgi:hypothetical protein
VNRTNCTDKPGHTKIAARLAANLTRKITLGGHEIVLPRGHRLDWYRLPQRRYDESVSDLCSILLKKYPEL